MYVLHGGPTTESQELLPSPRGGGYAYSSDTDICRALQTILSVSSASLGTRVTSATPEISIVALPPAGAGGHLNNAKSLSETVVRLHIATSRRLLPGERLAVGRPLQLFDPFGSGWASAAATSGGDDAETGDGAGRTFVQYSHQASSPTLTSAVCYQFIAHVRPGDWLWVVFVPPSPSTSNSSLAGAGAAPPRPTAANADSGGCRRLVIIESTPPSSATVVAAGEAGATASTSCDACGGRPTTDNVKAEQPRPWWARQRPPPADGVMLQIKAAVSSATAAAATTSGGEEAGGGASMLQLIPVGPVAAQRLLAARTREELQTLDDMLREMSVHTSQMLGGASWPPAFLHSGWAALEDAFDAEVKSVLSAASSAVRSIAADASSHLLEALAAEMGAVGTGPLGVGEAATAAETTAAATANAADGAAALLGGLRESASQIIDLLRSLAREEIPSAAAAAGVALPADLLAAAAMSSSARATSRRFGGGEKGGGGLEETTVRSGVYAAAQACDSALWF